MGNDEVRVRAADVVVIGGGVIGLAVARELAGAGSRVVLVERGQLGREASHAAAGMLAPQAEADAQDAFFDFAQASRRMFPEFASALFEETNVDVELDETGVLYPAFTDEEIEQLERRFTWQRAANLTVEMLTGDETRRLEPALSANVRGALFFPEDAQVENRLVVSALAASCERRGVDVLTQTEVLSIQTNMDGSRVEAIVTSRGRIEAETVVVASGAWASKLDAVARRFTIEPVRGQMLCLEAAPPLTRHVIYGSRVYLVPRRDNRLLVGATVERAGFDKRVTVAGMRELIAGAMEVSPRAGELTVLDSWAGLRPRAADALPIIGRDTQTANLIFAAGHYRNGILLAPLTARLVHDLVARPDATTEVLKPFSPARFSVEEARTIKGAS